jgi:large subunit ribosomal protein L6
MSRIGTAPIAIPDGVSVTVDGSTVSVKGPKGELSRTLTGGIVAEVKDGQLLVERTREEGNSRALHGLYRALCQGMVEGVEKGFSKTLDVVGVSYQAAIEGNKVRLQVGFSHPVLLEIPAGLTVECPSATRIVVSGCDKQLVGEFSARVRRVRPPEPYKGKGVRYFGEQVIQKAGKSFVGGEK